jgi:choline dehydrogenase-like flavoprotein
MEFTPRQLASLRLICDTFAPGDGASVPPASAVGAPELVVDLAKANPREGEVRQLAMLLKLWDSRVLGALLTMRPKRFSALSQEEREDVLLSLATSRIPQKRALFGALKNAALQTYYIRGGSPVWESMSFPGPLGNRRDAPAPALAPHRITEDSTITCDVVVVGSGAGGGTAAGVLAEAGLDVVVLEAGEYHDDADFDGSEEVGFTQLYSLAPNATVDGSIALVAGKGVGGGTVVNYTTSFRTPDHVREEWAGFGATQFAEQEYADAMDAVNARLGVNTDHDLAAPRDAVLERGAKALGWNVAAMPRNVRGCDMGVECGRCGLGCRIGAKQSTAKTWLADAAGQGARLYVGAKASRVVVTDGRATGVVAESEGKTLTVKARAVVVAAGAIQTPALLKRSGLRNPNIGKHLRLHPATVVWGLMDEDVPPWVGSMQSRYVDQHKNLDGDGYGVLYETGPATPALATLFVGWEGGRKHLARMQELGHLVPYAVLTRDRDSVGTVKVGRDGEPIVSYKLSDHDAAHMWRGHEGAAQLAEAAGARKVYSSHQAAVTFEPGRSGSPAGFAESCRRAGAVPGRFGLASLHIMGSARMGASAETSAVDPSGQAWDVKDLYVADASCFPTASGVNPMISIESIAYMNAKRLAAKLT